MPPTPASHDPQTPRPPLRARILGIDIARGVALFGMMATHVLPRMDETGDLTAVALLQGRASALFAILAGFSIILSTRSALAHTGGRGCAAASAGLVIRGALIALIGFALGELPSGIAIILVNYGVLFVIAPLFLRLPTWLLGVSAWAWFLVTPQLSHAIRSSVDSGFADSGLTVPAFSNMHMADTWVGLFLTGYYPLLQWVGYILLGMWLARIDWSDLHRRITLLIAGGALTTLALSASALLMNMRGRWELDSLYGEESVGSTHTSTASSCWAPTGSLLRTPPGGSSPRARIRARRSTSCRPPGSRWRCSPSASCWARSWTAARHSCTRGCRVRARCP